MNGRQIPSQDFSLNTTSTNMCAMPYQTLFSGLGIHHENMAIQVTLTQFMKRSFMLIFYLKPEGCASDCHTTLPINSNNRIELKFDEALVEVVTILLNQEFDASFQID